MTSTILLRTAAMACALVTTTAFSAPAPAQLPGQYVPPRRVTDARGVDLVSGEMLINVPLVSFGNHATALSASLELSPSKLGAPAGANFLNHRFGAGSALAEALRPRTYATSADGSRDEFGPFESFVFPTGAGFAMTLYPWGVNGITSVHTNPDGSRYTQSFGTSHFTRFESSDPNLTGIYDAEGTRGIIDLASPGWHLFERFIYANGEEWRFRWQYITVPCTLYCQGPTETLWRLRFVTASRGYGIQFLYMSDATPASNAVAGAWKAPRRVTGYNKADFHCNESLLQECTTLASLPSAAITYNEAAATALITESGQTEGTEVTFSTAWPNPTSIRHTAVPNSSVSFRHNVDNAGVDYITQINDSDGQWNYSRITYVDDSGRVPLMTARSTNPAGGQVAIFGYGQFGTIQWYGDELGRLYSYSDGFPFRDNGRTEPEGDDTFISRDERNNITSIIRYPKPNTGLSPLTVYAAAYPEHCMNPRTCNRPEWTRDANNNVTEYTYAPEHGGLLTETGPAPSAAAPRPQTRHGYTQRFAWISNGSGGYVRAATPIWVRIHTSSCRTSAATGNPAAPCAAGALDEVRTTYEYGPDSGPNNLLLRGQAVTAESGGAMIALRTCYGYDANGNRISETQPNANLASCP